jgi:hypothetical protein
VGVGAATAGAGAAAAGAGAGTEAGAWAVEVATALVLPITGAVAAGRENWTAVGKCPGAAPAGMTCLEKEISRWKRGCFDLSITETNKTHLVLLDMHNRTLCSYLAATPRILIPVMFERSISRYLAMSTWSPASVMRRSNGGGANLLSS